MSDPLVKISLRRRHAQTVQNGASSHKTNSIDIFSEILNLTAILVNERILPTGGVASGRVCLAACAAGLLLSHIEKVGHSVSETVGIQPNEH